jgi:hypothetical protein
MVALSEMTAPSVLTPPATTASSSATVRATTPDSLGGLDDDQAHITGDEMLSLCWWRLLSALWVALPFWIHRGRLGPRCLSPRCTRMRSKVSSPVRAYCRMQHLSTGPLMVRAVCFV